VAPPAKNARWPDVWTVPNESEHLEIEHLRSRVRAGGRRDGTPPRRGFSRRRGRADDRARRDADNPALFPAGPPG